MKGAADALETVATCAQVSVCVTSGVLLLECDSESGWYISCVLNWVPDIREMRVRTWRDCDCFPASYNASCNLFNSSAQDSSVASPRVSSSHNRSFGCASE